MTVHEAHVDSIPLGAVSWSTAVQWCWPGDTEGPHVSVLEDLVRDGHVDGYTIALPGGRTSRSATAVDLPSLVSYVNANERKGWYRRDLPMPNDYELADLRWRLPSLSRYETNPSSPLRANVGAFAGPSFESWDSRRYAERHLEWTARMRAIWAGDH